LGAHGGGEGQGHIVSPCAQLVFNVLHVLAENDSSLTTLMYFFILLLVFVVYVGLYILHLLVAQMTFKDCSMTVLRYRTSY